MESGGGMVAVSVVKKRVIYIPSDFGNRRHLVETTDGCISNIQNS
jgi:hypothetical protein